MAGEGRKPSLARALAQYRRRANTYDIELLAFEPLRIAAIQRLALRPGQCVLDVGCGTGLSFSRLWREVRPEGRIIGIDPSAEMMDKARERIARNQWNNIELVVAPAASAPLQGRADAALFHFTHDVLREGEAIDHVLAHLRPGARVVACGLRWAPGWLWPANLFVLTAALYSMSSLEGLARPWDQLASRLQSVRTEAYWMGSIFMLSGRAAGSASRR